MHRRGIIRIGIGLVCALAIAFAASFRPAPPAAALSAPRASMLLDTCGTPPDIHAGDGLRKIRECWSKPDPDPNTPTTIPPGITAIPCIDSGIGGIPWQNIDVFDAGSASSSAFAARSAGITALVGDDGSSSALYVLDIEGGEPCGGGHGAGGGGGGCGSGGCSGGGCGSGGGGGGGGNNPDCFGCDGGAFGLGSVRVRLPLGMANEHRSAGVLTLTCEGDPTSASLDDPTSLNYDFDDLFTYNSSPIKIIDENDPNTPTVRQIKTPAHLVVITQGSTSYSVTMYAPASIGTQSGSTPYLFPITGDPFRQWEFEYDSGTLTIYDRVWDAGEDDLVLRGTFIYEYDSDEDTWTLTTKDATDAVVREEVMTDWEEPTSSPRSRTYTILVDSTPVYQHTETQTSYGGIYRRTSLTVNPGGDERTTTWAWSVLDGGAGLVLDSVTRPDGSWTNYSYDYDSENHEWTITTESPWEDGADSLFIVRKFGRVDSTKYYRLNDERAVVGEEI